MQVRESSKLHEIQKYITFWREGKEFQSREWVSTVDQAISFLNHMFNVAPGEAKLWEMIYFSSFWWYDRIQVKKMTGNRSERFETDCEVINILINIWMVCNKSDKSETHKYISFEIILTTSPQLTKLSVLM